MTTEAQSNAELTQETNPLAGVALTFVGVGVMAEAMIAGLLKQQLVQAAQVRGSHPRAARREELAQRYGIRMVESNRAAVAPTGDAASTPHGAIVVLAVKPQKLHGVLQELKAS